MQILKKIFVEWINECLKHTDNMFNAKLGIFRAGVITRQVEADERVERVVKEGLEVTHHIWAV